MESSEQEKQLQKFLLGSCPNCGTSWKGCTNIYLTELDMRIEKIQKKHGLLRGKKPPFKNFLQNELARTELSPDEKKEAKERCAKIYKMKNATRAKSLNDNIVCPDCGMLFKMQFDDDQQKNNK